MDIDESHDKSSFNHNISENIQFSEDTGIPLRNCDLQWLIHILFKSPTHFQKYLPDKNWQKNQILLKISYCEY